MRIPIYILSILFIITGCNSKNEKFLSLKPGMYFLNKNLSNDTLFFQLNKPKSVVRDWGLIKWQVTEDSVFRYDDRGIYNSAEMNKCSYVLNNDTLTLKIVRINDKKMKEKKEIDFVKYIVIKSNKISLTLLPINDSISIKSEIRSDVQL